MFSWFFAEAGTPRPEEDPTAPLPEGERQDDRETVGEAVTGALGSGLLAWGISFLLHAGIVLLGIFIVWSYIEAIDEEELIIPIARLSDTPGAPVQVTTQERVQQQSSQRRSISRSEQLTPSTIQTKVNLQTQLIGLSGGAASRASPMGTAIGTAGDFGVEFFGSGGNARTLVFVVDASGSLIDTLPFVIRELQRTINELSEEQRFSVLFFQNDRVTEVPPAGLKRATTENKQRVIDWIELSSGNIAPGGRTDPIRAMRQALAYRPQLVFLLSDNITGGGHAGATRYELDQRRLLAEIERANTGRTKINTIQFLYPDPRNTLKMISDATGADHRFVQETDLVRR